MLTLHGKEINSEQARKWDWKVAPPTTYPKACDIKKSFTFPFHWNGKPMVLHDSTWPISKHSSAPVGLIQRYESEKGQCKLNIHFVWPAGKFSCMSFHMDAGEKGEEPGSGESSSEEDDDNDEESSEQSQVEEVPESEQEDEELGDPDTMMKSKPESNVERKVESKAKTKGKTNPLSQQSPASSEPVAPPQPAPPQPQPQSSAPPATPQAGSQATRQATPQAETIQSKPDAPKPDAPKSKRKPIPPIASPSSSSSRSRSRSRSSSVSSSRTTSKSRSRSPSSESSVQSPPKRQKKRKNSTSSSSSNAPSSKKKRSHEKSNEKPKGKNQVSIGGQGKPPPEKDVQVIPYRGGDHGGDGGGDNQDHGDNQDELGECLQQCIPEFEHAILELGNRTPKVITLYCGPQRMDQCEDLPITAKRLTKPLVVVGSECKCFGLNQRQLSSNKHAFDVTTNDKYQDLFCMAGEAMMEPKAKPSEEQDDGLRFVPRVMGVVKCPSFFHGCFITQSLPELSLGGSREVGGEEETKWLCVNPNRFRLIVSITIKTTTGPEQYSVELPSFASLCMTSRCTLTVPKNGPNMPGYLVVFADGYLTNITPPKVASAPRGPPVGSTVMTLTDDELQQRMESVCRAYMECKQSKDHLRSPSRDPRRRVQDESDAELKCNAYESQLKLFKERFVGADHKSRKLQTELDNVKVELERTKKQVQTEVEKTKEAVATAEAVQTTMETTMTEWKREHDAVIQVMKEKAQRQTQQLEESRHQLEESRHQLEKCNRDLGEWNYTKLEWDNERAKWDKAKSEWDKEKATWDESKVEWEQQKKQMHNEKVQASEKVAELQEKFREMQSDFEKHRHGWYQEKEQLMAQCNKEVQDARDKAMLESIDSHVAVQVEFAEKGQLWEREKTQFLKAIQALELRVTQFQIKQDQLGQEIAKQVSDFVGVEHSLEKSLSLCLSLDPPTPTPPTPVLSLPKDDVLSLTQVNDGLLQTQVDDVLSLTQVDDALSLTQAGDVLSQTQTQTQTQADVPEEDVDVVNEEVGEVQHGETKEAKIQNSETKEIKVEDDLIEVSLPTSTTSTRLTTSTLQQKKNKNGKIAVHLQKLADEPLATSKESSSNLPAMPKLPTILGKAPTQKANVTVTGSTQPSHNKASPHNRNRSVSPNCRSNKRTSRSRSRTPPSRRYSPKRNNNNSHNDVNRSHYPSRHRTSSYSSTSRPTDQSSTTNRSTSNHSTNRSTNNHSTNRSTNPSSHSRAHHSPQARSPHRRRSSSRQSSRSRTPSSEYQRAPSLVEEQKLETRQRRLSKSGWLERHKRPVDMPNTYKKVQDKAQEQDKEETNQPPSVVVEEGALVPYDANVSTAIIPVSAAEQQPQQRKPPPGCYLDDCNGRDVLVYVPQQEYLAVQAFLLTRKLQLPYWQRNPLPTLKTGCAFLTAAPKEFMGAHITKILQWEKRNNALLDLSKYKVNQRIGTIFEIRDTEGILTMWRCQDDPQQPALRKVQPASMAQFCSKYLKWSNVMPSHFQRKESHAFAMIMTIIAIASGEIPDWNSKPASEWFLGAKDSDNTITPEKSCGEDMYGHGGNRNWEEAKDSNTTSCSPPFLECSLQSHDDLHKNDVYQVCQDGRYVLAGSYNHQSNRIYGEVRWDSMPTHCTHRHQEWMKRLYYEDMGRQRVDLLVGLDDVSVGLRLSEVFDDVNPFGLL